MTEASGGWSSLRYLYRVGTEFPELKGYYLLHSAEQ
jgi:hypothetical protein